MLTLLLPTLLPTHAPPFTHHTQQGPSWVPVTDNQPVRCQSIASLDIAAYDSDTVFAGCGGSTSSEMGGDWNVLNDGPWGGVLLSVDGGVTWAQTGFPPNWYVGDSAIVVAGVCVCVCKNVCVFFLTKGCPIPYPY